MGFGVLGLRYPLQMLPLLMFEFVWKAIWLIGYGLLQWSSGQLSPTFCRRLPEHRARRNPHAARDSVGVRLSPLRQTAGEPLAVMSGLAGGTSSWEWCGPHRSMTARLARHVFLPASRHARRCRVVQCEYARIEISIQTICIPLSKLVSYRS